MIALIIIPAIIPVILMVANFLLAKKSDFEREKPSPFECGFDPLCSARMPFSLHFFLMTVIFLIFDVELTLILPITQSLHTLMIIPMITLSLIFLIILILGLYLEWSQGALEWYF
uniref:NADH-ubiquinone oxidoreductase chain 3 n=1 Tax=Tullbergia bisetosa TaxID=345630 RepID=A0A5P9W7K4_9HEXA|nr:NADH dehydrogenase subunit 3 [Tullbergia bisetosa]